MKSALIATLLLITTALPAMATQVTFNFVFSGADYSDAPNAAGAITFEDTYLLNPGRKVFNLGTSDGMAAVLSLNVTVTGATGGAGNGNFTRADFSQVIFDTSLIGLDLTRELVGQGTSSPTGLKWGEGESIPGTTNSSLQSYTGDFEIFAVDPSSSAPSGIWFFQIGTNNGNDDGMQLTSFTPVTAVPTPATWLLTVSGLCVLGVVKKIKRFNSLKRNL